MKPTFTSAPRRLVICECARGSPLILCIIKVLSTFADDFDYQKLDDLIRTALEGDEVWLCVIILSQFLMLFCRFETTASILTS